MSTTERTDAARESFAATESIMRRVRRVYPTAYAEAHLGGLVSVTLHLGRNLLTSGHHATADGVDDAALLGCCLAECYAEARRRGLLGE